jgi:YfiH family protein
MPFIQSGAVRYFYFQTLDYPDITHAVFTRHGGYSPPPWESLNMGGMLGDDDKRVVRNRTLAFKVVGRDPTSIFDVWQIHSAKVICVDAPRRQGFPYIKADALLTSNPEVTLFMRFADCVPIFLFDPFRKVVGLVHSGWKGTLKKIVQEAVFTMVQKYDSKPRNIRAGIGPSISFSQYPIGVEVADLVRNKLGSESENVLTYVNGAVQFDLWEANRILLTQVGLHDIEMANICTASQLDDWYSHRGEGGKTGRFGALIGLNIN